MLGVFLLTTIKKKFFTYPNILKISPQVINMKTTEVFYILFYLLSNVVCEWTLTSMSPLGLVASPVFSIHLWLLYWVHGELDLTCHPM